MKKLIITIFLGLLLINSISILSFILSPIPANAEARVTLPAPIIKIPGAETFSKPVKCGTTIKGDNIYCIPWIGQYINAVYNYSIGIIGILSAVVLMFGGLTWITAGGNPSRIGEAKAWITASLTGLIIMMASYTILFQINPDTVKMGSIEVIAIKPKASSGCCIADNKCSMTSSDGCTGTFSKEQVCSLGACVNPGDEITCCQISYTWILGVGGDTICYKNILKKNCSSSGSIFDISSNARNIKYFPIPEKPECINVACQGGPKN